MRKDSSTIEKENIMIFFLFFTIVFLAILCVALLYFSLLLFYSILFHFGFCDLS
jgi:hypothetical protein